MPRGGIRIRQLAHWAAALAVVFATGELHARMPPTTQADAGESYLPRPEFAKAMSLGFDALLADVYWLQAVQLVGGREIDPSQHAAHIGRIVDVVTTLDPWVDHPYRFAAVWMTDSPESVREANRLLRRGIEHHPREWRNHFYLGFNHFFYLREPLQAAVALEHASALPGAPQYLPRLAARLRSDGESLDSAAVFLMQLIRDTDDEAKRSEYQEALDEIEIERKARFLEQARAAYREHSGRDLTSLDELTRGETPLLPQLPSAEPSSLPDSLRRGSRWVIDEEGRIVSEYYGRRYEVTIHATDRRRQQSWAGQLPESPIEGGPIER